MNTVMPSHYITGGDEPMEETVQCRSPDKIRELYATLLSSCGLSNPKTRWNKYKEFMAEDILHQLQQVHTDITFNEHVYIKTLIIIENKVFTMVGKKLDDFGMSSPRRDNMDDFDNEIARELDYDFLALQHQVTELVPQLLIEQNHVFMQVLRKINFSSGGLFFLDAPGGTAKTFLLNLLLISVRKDQKITVAVAESGIVATLLNGGRTAHSVLKLPLNLSQEDSPICNFSKNSSRDRMLRERKLLVLDENTMSHNKAIKALNRILQDFRDSTDIMGAWWFYWLVISVKPSQ
ncbi:uncharacterized protein LOC125779708 [Bactrocera dorsalis]|uniref:ATP-dependent DNA helicase n=1 Tax=Bactrocera dorsalis TaxID=27457 RepID=A0ABM3K636_BACDO|nr:uncharacterized protein LOC125779708 [Bactrocera dorsalis]